MCNIRDRLFNAVSLPGSVIYLGLNASVELSLGQVSAVQIVANVLFNIQRFENCSFWRDIIRYV
jgi:hypothetical protein